jgi:hypothetical protein
VNGLRQEATPLAHWSGYVAGVNQYNDGVLCGNWEETRHEPHAEPRSTMIPSANARNWVTMTKRSDQWLGGFESKGEPKLAADNMYETSSMAASKDVTDPKPRPDFFHKPGFDLDAYRQQFTIGNEVTRARYGSTENRDMFKVYENATATTGYPKVRRPRASSAGCGRFVRTHSMRPRPAPSSGPADLRARAPPALRGLAQNRAGHSGLWH